MANVNLYPMKNAIEPPAMHKMASRGVTLRVRIKNASRARQPAAGPKQEVIFRRTTLSISWCLWGRRNRNGRQPQSWSVSEFMMFSKRDIAKDLTRSRRMFVFLYEQ